MERRYYLVCYDIADDRRLARVHRRTKDFGTRLQFSVYGCEMSEVDLARLRESLWDIINHAEDSVLFIDLGTAKHGTLPKCVDAIGVGPQTPDHKRMIL